MPIRMLAIVAAVTVSLVLAVACGNGEEDDGPQPASPTPDAMSTLPPATSTPSPVIGTPAPAATPLFEPYTPEPGTANLLGNGDFESGRDYWFSLKPPDFELSSDVAHSGQASALLRMRDPVDTEGTTVYYLVQEVVPEEFPEVISGYYRIENWSKGTLNQYAQFVVIAFDVDNIPRVYSNHQIRYILTGIDQNPFGIANAFFVYLGEKEPTTDEWVYFEANVKEDFQEFWQAVPEGYSKLRLLFEVRYDDKSVGEGPAEADVYYDDLYMGPASENPNQP